MEEKRNVYECTKCGRVLEELLSRIPGIPAGDPFTKSRELYCRCDLQNPLKPTEVSEKETSEDVLIEILKKRRHTESF